MNFEFIIDKNYLLLKLISNRNNLDEVSVWKKSEVEILLSDDIVEDIESRKDSIEEFFISGESGQYVLDNNLEDSFVKLMESSLFKKYYQETLDYLNLIKEYWEKVKNRINTWLESKVKLSFSNASINVYISHPRLNVGKCVDQKNIFWGHFKGLENVNYNIIYLCHENLHALLPNENCMPPAMNLYYSNETELNGLEYWKLLNERIPGFYKVFDFEFDIIHTVIELISDNELYTFLSGESKYHMGHNSKDYSLVKYKEMIKPYWFLYLSLNEDEIKKRDLKVDTSDVELFEEAKLSLDNFINFLINNKFIRKSAGVTYLPDNVSIKL